MERQQDKGTASCKGTAEVMELELNRVRKTQVDTEKAERQWRGLWKMLNDKRGRSGWSCRRSHGQEGQSRCRCSYSKISDVARVC